MNFDNKPLEWNCPYCGDRNKDVFSADVCPLRCGGCENVYTWDEIADAVARHYQIQIARLEAVAEAAKEWHKIARNNPLFGSPAKEATMKLVSAIDALEAEDADES